MLSIFKDLSVHINGQKQLIDPPLAFRVFDSKFWLTPVLAVFMLSRAYSKNISYHIHPK